jgi:hypothetical protein
MRKESIMKNYTTTAIRANLQAAFSSEESYGLKVYCLQQAVWYAPEVLAEFYSAISVGDCLCVHGLSEACADLGL